MNRIALIVLFALASVENASSKAVITSFDSNWKSTSFLAEASEFISDENSDLFAQFINQVNDDAEKFVWDELSEAQKYKYTVGVAEKILIASTVKLLKFSLALRQYSPRIQAFQHSSDKFDHSNCEFFIVVNGEVSCEVADYKNLLKKGTSDVERILAIDHVSGSKRANDVVVLYGELGTQSFAKAFRYLESLSSADNFKLVFRHHSKNISPFPTSLSGYGVELALKNTEYISLDGEKNAKIAGDRGKILGVNITKLQELHKQVSDKTDLFGEYLEYLDESTPLKTWELQDLGYQASQKVMNSQPRNALAALEEFSQNFPLHTRTLARTSVSEELRKEVLANRMVLKEFGIDEGKTSLFINGIDVDVDSLDLFKLVDLLRKEDKLVNEFNRLGIEREYTSILAAIESSDETSTKYAVDYSQAEPFFINDLEKDEKYQHLDESLKLMLHPYPPGRLRPIARNLFNLICVIDPSTEEGRHLMKLCYRVSDAAMRVGFVFIVDDNQKENGKTNSGVALLNLFNFIAMESSNKDAVQVLIKITENFDSNRPTPAQIEQMFKATFPDVDYEKVFGGNSKYDTGRKAGAVFSRMSGIGKLPKMLLNGFVLDSSDSIVDHERIIIEEIARITPKIQQAIVEGRLTDEMDVGEWVLKQKEVIRRLNERISSAPKAENFLNLLGSQDHKNYKTVEDLKKFYEVDKAGYLIATSKYLQKSSFDEILPITLWVVADVETVEGRRFILNAVKAAEESSKIRMSIIFNPVDVEKVSSRESITSHIRSALEVLPMEKTITYIGKLCKEESNLENCGGCIKPEVDESVMQQFLTARDNSNSSKVYTDSLLATDLFGIKKGQRMVIGNGLKIGPLRDDEHFEPEDFKFLEAILISKGAEVISTHLKETELDASNGAGSNAVLSIFSHIGRYETRKRSWVKIREDTHSVVKMPADSGYPESVDVLAIVNPLSAEAQKLGTILRLIQNVTNSNIRIVMNPKEAISELPLKRFYRYAAFSELSFDENENLVPSTVRFGRLPSRQILTMSLQYPDSWIAELVSTEYDLDNIKMNQVQEDIVAVFSLQHLLVEGHCFDTSDGVPPRGLQLVLGTHRNSKKFDTIVMANLGYFQLKANPGLWELKIREGISSEIYEIRSHSEAREIEKYGLEIVIDSFAGKTVTFGVGKKKGMERRDLLSEEETSVFSKISKKVFGEKAPETINIFSLASGHLYERFLKIMFVSVMKNTKHPVKFWILKSYLSPNFKKTLPILASHYGFQYELVEYKWPRWLNQQKEKQRVMWGFKILFLDVLFPLDVEKIIFVDADQVVRADMMELMQFDLGNAPYGYVPFCESRKEMDGFRFWKQGYWAQHLDGRRYHISALYVVDLKKFRQLAAGDRLRAQYQRLSMDPNSLANLDQDLPNNMIYQVEIKSLPQSWLWCETWCDDSSKQRAKTIDLCNNPLTKEPKLEAAVRIIGEWKDYDEEIRNVVSGNHTVFRDRSEL